MTSRTFKFKICHGTEFQVTINTNIFVEGTGAVSTIAIGVEEVEIGGMRQEGEDEIQGRTAKTSPRRHANVAARRATTKSFAATKKKSAKSAAKQGTSKQCAATTPLLQHQQEQ